MADVTLIDVPKAQSELAELESKFAEVMQAVIAAGTSGNIVEAARLGNQMVEVGKSRDALKRKIDKALGGGTDSAVKIEARDKAFAALREYFTTDAAVVVRDSIATIGKVKEIRIQFEDNAITGFKLVGGIREIKASGITRQRVYWTGGSLRNTVVGNGTLVGAFAGKYGDAPAEGSKGRAKAINTLREKIVKGEKLVQCDKDGHPVAAA